MIYAISRPFAIGINLNGMCKLIFVSDKFFGYPLGSTELSEKAWWSKDENELRSLAIKF